MKGGDRNLLRDLNVALVSHLLRTYQPISRVELASRAGLGRSTITEIISLLMDEGIVAEVGEAESTGGRKPVLLELVARSRLVAAVRVGPRSVSLGLADLNGHLIARHRRALRGGRSAGEALQQIVTWVTEMMREYGPESSRVIGLGLVLPGRVEPETGLLHSWPLLQWEEERVGPQLTERLGMPVVVESDATAFALGEQRHGGARADERLLAVTLGAGVGAAFIQNGQSIRGSTGSMSALGHVQVDPEGPLCCCGQRGCLEAMVSDEALVARAGTELERGTESLLVELSEGRREALTREMIVAAAQDGDLLCLRLLAQAGEWVGQALAPVVNLLGPTTLLLGGDALEQAGSLLVEPIKATLQPRLVNWVADLPVRQAVLGEVAWLSGAAELVLQRAFQSPLQALDALSVAAWVTEEA